MNEMLTPNLWVKNGIPSRWTTSTDHSHRRVLAEVQVPAEIAVAADDLRQDVGAAGVMELGLLRELAHVQQSKEVPLQLVDLVGDVGI